ncbi:cell adhesion molecule Dscam1 [Bemisia tabaci]
MNICLAVLLLPAVYGVSIDLKGPIFTVEPQYKLQFSNDTGGRVDCAAHGNPPPDIEWTLGDGTPAVAIPGLRTSFPNGTLLFPPFSAENYRHDVHTAIYRCKARNLAGIALSRLVYIRAVVKHKYEVQVYDEYVISGNTAVLRCRVPNHVTEFIMVTSWIQDGDVNIYPNTDTGGKYAVLDSGEIYIFNAGPGDGYKNFVCRTVHRLTGETQSSVYPGRIIITEPKESVQPTISVEKHAKKQVKLGEDVTLPCVAQAYPIPSYRWFKEEKDQLVPLRYNDRIYILAAGLLRINKVRLDDRGKYICWVNNTAGEDTVQMILSVSSPLRVLMQPQFSVVDVGKEASFQCIISGFPSDRVSWYYNGRPLVNSGRVHISSDPERLIVSLLTKEDHGIYQCFVNNDWDMATGTAQLQLGDASPELIHWFSEQTLQPGPPVSLKCVATGNPPPQFIWTLDGFPLPDSTRFLVGQYVTVHDDVISHVNISSVKEEDGGEYSCSARNSVATVSHSARINVYGLPFIRVMPRVTAVAGSNLIIKCPVAGYPIESVIWEQDGSVLPMNRRQRVYSNGTLVIEQVQRSSDAGMYTCQAQNRQKYTARRDVEIQVLVPPKIMPIQPMTNLLREGMRAAISCQILEGDLPVTFKWEKDGVDSESLNLGANLRRIDEYSASLIIERISSMHTGNYTCIAQNLAGIEKYTIPLTVNGTVILFSVSSSPRWTVEPMDSSAASGQDTTLNCQASGYPVPSIIWRKAIGNHPGEYKDFLYEPNVNFYRNGTLLFRQVSKDSEGHYLCEAKNEIGSGVSKVIFLKVNAPAYFPQKSKQMQVKKGENAHLQCTALGDNPIEIMWKLNGQRISEDMDMRYSVREQVLDEGTVSELGIRQAHRHDTGVFTCYASNSYGQDEMNVQLIVQEPPEMPKNIRIMDQQSRSLQLSWTQSYAGNSPVINYIVQYKLISDLWSAQPAKVVIPGTVTSATLENLLPASSYHLRIIAENKLGMSDPSEVIQVTTQEEAPTGAPREVKVEPKSSTELHVSWEPPPRDSWNGNLLGYYVGYQELLALVTSSPAYLSTPAQSYNMKTVEIGSQFGGEIITGLATFTTYSVVIQAFNSKGTGPLSEPVIARTLEGAPTLPPEKVVCSAVSSSSLQVQWEPPLPEGRNGVIQGYKVSHQPAEDWYEREDFETKVTTAMRTNIPGLFKYTNYSISVLAFTASGDGVRSPSIYCRTEEDVPSAPADIKASLSSAQKILVSWLPPKNRNGELTGYTVYYSTVDSNNREEGPHKRQVSIDLEEYEIIRQQESAVYRFWVTASTKVGEGESTKVVNVAPSKKVPAKIISFSQTLITPWKRNLTLHCKKVGVPLPQAVWRANGKIVDSNGRFYIRKDSTLAIRDIQHSDGGNYTCFVENQFGNDEITYRLVVRIPPAPPQLMVVDEDTDSLSLQWANQPQLDIPILGYVINYKREHGDWEEVHIDSKSDSITLRNLWCGTRYQLYITAFNKIGTGLPCDIVNAHTKGTTPIKPTASQVLTVNSSAVSVWLDAWGDGGCPILYYIIEYHADNQAEWLLSSKPVQPTERVYTISNLLPATKYFLKITAHNNIGSAVAVYNFTTLTIDGATVTPEQTPVVSDPSSSSFFSLFTVVFLIILVIMVSAAFVGSFFYFRKKRLEPLTSNVAESMTIARLQNQQNRDQQYGVRGQSQQLSIDSNTYKTDSTDYIEDICPYATFQLSKAAYSESSYSGNIYSGPYHSVRGSFVYHDLPSTAANTYKSRHRKEPEYTKVRRKGSKLRDPHSESQESDNLGSTDSEVKKILTLHLPISEYDTLGSDSEGEDGGQSQELVSFRHRLGRADVGKAGDDSSSSSESPTAHRKQIPPSRKAKSKNQGFGKRPVKSSSGYSSHTEETTFSFNDRINPPSRFSDSRSHSRELSETDCDLNKLAIRRSSRGSTRLSREASFQINV